MYFFFAEKWQPPFRPSQVLYSEFPEDRGRSLDIDRQDIARRYPDQSGQVHQDVTKRQPDRHDVSRKGYPYTAYAYEPVQSNRLPDDQQPRDYSDDYPAGNYRRFCNSSVTLFHSASVVTNNSAKADSLKDSFTNRS